MNALPETVSSLLRDPDFTRVTLDGSLKSFVVLLAAGALCLVWRRASAATRHFIWFFAVLSLPLLPIISMVAPGWRQPLWSVSTSLDAANQFALQLEWSPRTAAKNIPDDHADAETSGEDRGQIPAIRNATSVTAGFSARWLMLLVGVWAGGVFVALIPYFAGHIVVRSMGRGGRSLRDNDWIELLEESCARLGIRREVTLLLSGANTMPSTWGWLRPMILLPANAVDWTDERRRIVLLHELAHISRWDCATQAVTRLICSLWWFNPLVWLAARRMRVEREHACDDLILASGWKASAYADQLLEIANSFRRVPRLAAISMARPGGLGDRITAILDRERTRGATAIHTIVLVILFFGAFGFVLGGWAKAGPGSSTGEWSLEKSIVGEQLRRFVAEKREQALAAAKADGTTLLPEYEQMFAAAAKGDWPAIQKTWSDLRERAPQYEGRSQRDPRLHGTGWQTIIEIWGAFGNLAAGDEKAIATLAQDAIAAIKPGSIYFGGTDPGRMLITALCKSQVHADPFFTLTQNALADKTYLKYARDMYGARIYTPTDDDSEKCFNEYLAGAQKRLAENKLKPGEDVKMVDGHAQVSGQIAVMSINALLAKVIFDKNPEKEFYIEESFPLDWMYPLLTPSGPIMKLNRQAQGIISEEIVRKDRDYWTRAVKPMIGDWLDYDTPLTTVAEFGRKAGMPRIVGDFRDPQSDSASKWASKLRASIAGVYDWHVNHAVDAADRARMAKEADFAFRQAFALCPYSPEAVFRYVNFLVGQHRKEDALLIARAAAHVDTQNKQLAVLVGSLEKL